MSQCPLPSGVSESEFMAAVNKTAKLLGHAFSFGHYTPEDVAQEVRLYSVELLKKGKFDPSRPLEAYILTHCRRRLCNLRRDKMFRPEPACPACNKGNFCTGDGPCQKHLVWARRNQTKAGLCRPLDLGEMPADQTPRTGDSDVEKSAEATEFTELLDQRMPVDLRQDFLRMKEGLVVSTPRRRLVREFVLNLMDDMGMDLKGLENLEL